MADTTIDLLKNSSYVGKMDELIAAVKSGGGTASEVEWDNVKNKPTTIVGYGITDAKIDNGTITLGDNTITPLTSAPVTSVNGESGDVQIDSLPNPEPLSFTGAITGTYDGSEGLSIEIPKDNTFVCTITGSGTTTSPYVCDKTTVQIYAALQAGKIVIAKYIASMYNLLGAQGPQLAVFGGLLPNNNIRHIKVDANKTVTIEDYQSLVPEAKTDAMTQAVGKDADGKLWTAPGSGGGFAPTLVASLVTDGTTTSIMQNIDIAYPAIYTVSIYGYGIADTDNAGQYLFAVFGVNSQFGRGPSIRSIKTVSNTFTNQMVALTFALDAEKKIRTIGKAESQADNLTNWVNYQEGGTLEGNGVIFYSSTNKIIPAGFKCDVWRWM